MDTRAADPRYGVVATMHEAGKIKYFRDIFKYIPKTRVAKDMGMKGDRWNQCADSLEEFDLKHIFTMAWLFGISIRDMANLVLNEYEEKKAMVEKYNKG